VKKHFAAGKLQSERQSMRRFFQYLRTAWSVISGILCVLLIALCIRSYWRCDSVVGYLGPYHNFHASTQRGDFGLAVWRDSWNPGAPRLALATHPTTDEPLIAPFVEGPLAIIGIRWLVSTGFVFLMPLWWPLLLLALSAVLSCPRWNWRFSLRTLLIATTLVAVALGAIVYAAKI
jgi:hypothetical protein